MNKLITYNEALKILNFTAKNMHKALERHGIVRQDGKGKGSRALYKKNDVMKLAEDLRQRKIPKSNDEWTTRDIAVHFNICHSTANKLVKQPGFPLMKRNILEGISSKPTRVWDVEEVKLVRLSDFKGYNSPRSERQLGRKRPRNKEQVLPITKLLNVEMQFLRGFI